MIIVLTIHCYYPEIMGGAEYSTKYLAEKLVEMGNEVHVICSGDENKEEIIEGVFIHRFKTKSICRANKTKQYSVPIRIFRRLQDIYNPLNYPALKKIISAISPDVIHVQTILELTPVIWKIAQELGIRCVYTLREYSLLCPKSSLVCHHAKGECYNPLLPCSVFRKLNSWNQKNVNAVTFLSHKMQEIVHKHGFFLNVEQYVVPNATSYDKKTIRKIIECREKRLFKQPVVRFVYLGNLVELKGIYWLFEAFEKLSNCELIIAGKGELEEFVKQKTKELGNVKFMGFLNEHGVDELLSEVDVLLAISLWHEPFGRVVLDAYKHGMPVISSDRGALPELVENERTGFVVKGNDVLGLQDRMQYYIDHPYDIIEHGKNSMNKLEEFSLDKQAEKFLEIYKHQ